MVDGIWFTDSCRLFEVFYLTDCFCQTCPCTETAHMFCHELFSKCMFIVSESLQCCNVLQIAEYYPQITLTDIVLYCTRQSCTNWTQFYIAIMFQPLLSVMQYIKNTWYTRTSTWFKTALLRLNDFCLDYVNDAIQQNIYRKLDQTGFSRHTIKYLLDGSFAHCNLLR